MTCIVLKKVVGRFKIETPKNVFIDEFISLGNEAFSFKCGSNDTNKMKGISKGQSKSINFEEYYTCLFGKDY